MDRLAVGMLCLALLAPALAQAEVYTWKDAAGKTVFSDQPPPNVQARRMSVKAPQAATQASAPAAPMVKPADKNAASDVAAKNAQIEAQNAKIREENCRRAKANLNVLQQNGRVVLPGTVRDLANDKQRADLMRQAQQDMQTWCGSK